MSDARHTFVALLRGINVSGQKTIPMVELRAMCKGIGCDDVQTYIQSGNVVFSSVISADALEKRFEKAISKRFNFSVPVFVRPALSWSRYVASNPFPEEAKKEGNWVLLALSKLPPSVSAATELQRFATQGDRVVKKGDAIWIHYANGIGRSKLTPALLDRHVGSSVTARNWRTVLKLDEMLGELE